MKIKYNKIENSIEIKDGLKNQYMLLKFVMITNLLNALLNLYDVRDTGIGFIEIIWMILGIVSIVMMFVFIAKRSTLENVPIEKIKRLKEKTFFGRKRFSLELVDGKRRNLMELKTQAEIDQLRKVISDRCIQN
ncbi:MAG: hypothetical protein ACJA2S_005527 [Cyclobacteriaceae bacterium]|jgi:hypothetical protein